MRRLAVTLFRANSLFDEALKVCERDSDYTAAMCTVKESNCSALASRLLRCFAEEKKDGECFAACLVVAYELIPPDLALELAWKNGFTELAMPYFIQVMQHQSLRIGALEALAVKNMQEEETKKKTNNDFGSQGANGDINQPPNFAAFTGHLALMPPTPFGQQTQHTNNAKLFPNTINTQNQNLNAAVGFDALDAGGVVPF
eukprot:GHVT01002565.1.p1 GENE.GHVT01002565.1~~GHVT01002565.1.p1  ORF type:complete len:201 (-),score=56.17 GHVT01002565.1:921-1523(-)